MFQILSLCIFDLQLYRDLQRHTKEKFNCVPLFQEGHPTQSTVVVVGTITDDLRLLTFPKTTVCALHVPEKARERILKVGVQVFTFDQSALKSPTGKKILLLQGKRTVRTV